MFCLFQEVHDLLQDYENEDIIKELMLILKDKVLVKCNYKKIMTKCTKEMSVRLSVLEELGYKLTNRLYIGKEDNKHYKDYYVKKK